MPLLRIIYASQPFGYDEAMLGGILADARRCNQRDDITGALICRADLYLQLLEGPADRVEATYARICVDSRHLGVTPLAHDTVQTRLFPAWAMRDDPARSLMWSAAEVTCDAVARASNTEALAVFTRLASA